MKQKEMSLQSLVGLLLTYRRAGHKDAVEWIEGNFPYRMPVDGRFIDESKLQAQKKEWGL